MADQIDIVRDEGDLADHATHATRVPFSFDMDLEEMARVAAFREDGRFFVPMAGGRAIGSGGSFGYEATLPGGARVAAAGLTFLAVVPTHRRRGVLTKMMRVILDEAHGRGEALAALWASEATIYGRFGFGQAVEGRSLRLDVRRAEWRTARPRGAIQLLTSDEARAILPTLHEAACARHGMLGRSDHLWDTYALADEQWMRAGHTKRRIGLWIGDSGPEGYLFFRTKLGSDSGSVRVPELFGLTPDAIRGLMGFASDIDLMDEVTYLRRPADDPLPWMVVDSRAVQTAASEYAWFRVLDVPEVLGARTYERDGDLVLDVSDPFCNWNEGRWRLEVRGGIGSCARTDAASDVCLDVSELAALVMGGRSAFSLAAAERIVGSPAAVSVLDGLFRTGVAPWTPESF